MFVEGNEVVQPVLATGAVKGPLVVGTRIFLSAPFFLGEEASVEILESSEFAGEFGDGRVAAKRVVEARFQESEDSTAQCAGMSLAGELDGASGLAQEVGSAGVLVVAGVEPDEGTVAGLELETFRSRFGDDFESLVVGVLVAKFDHSLLVLGREVGEFGTRFPEFGWSVHSDVSFLKRRLGGCLAPLLRAGRWAYTSFVKGSAVVCGHRQGEQRMCVLRTQGGKSSGPEGFGSD